MLSSFLSIIHCICWLPITFTCPVYLVEYKQMDLLRQGWRKAPSWNKHIVHKQSENTMCNLKLQGVPTKIQHLFSFLLFMIIISIVICFIWAEIGCPPVRFAYRNMPERCAVPQILRFRFWLSNPMVYNRFIIYIK